MWTPGLVCQMFCTSVVPLVFPRDPQKTGETRDDRPLDKQRDLAPVPWRSSRLLCWVFSTCASLQPLEATALCVARVVFLRVLHVVPPRCLWRRDVTLFAFCRDFPRRPKLSRPNKGTRRPQKAPQKTPQPVPRSPQGALVVQQVSKCALWCHCCLRVAPVWFCCASEIRPGVCCVFCACYALHVSLFRPPFGGQHPDFYVLQAPV